MQRASAMAIAVLAVALTGPAGADDAIKAGKWEFSAEVQVPNMPKLPPGVTLPPGLKMGPGGVKISRTSCVNATAPMPADIHPPNQQHGQCNVAKLESDGGTVRWDTTCTQPDGTSVQAEGLAHYAGDTMEATVKTRVSGGGNPPGETTQHVIGHYLGPCDDK